MTGEIGPNFRSVYDELLEKVPELRQKIENGNLVHKDILAIARSIFVQERGDGSISIEKRSSKDRNIEISPEQVNLIRRICTLRGKQPSAEVHIVRKVQKRKLEDGGEEESVKRQKPAKEERATVPIRRGKRKAAEQEEQPTKKLKSESSKPKIKEAEDVFAVTSETPEVLLALMAEYIDETPTAIVDFAFKGNIPKYLKDNLTYLDLSNERLTFATFMTIVNEFKNLKSITLPKDADDAYLEILSQKLPNLESLEIRDCEEITDEGLGHIAANMKSIQWLRISGCQHIGDIGVDLILNELKSLETLNLRHCHGVKDEAFKNVNLCESLRDLDLTDTSITDKGLGFIVDGVKGLHRLVLKYNKAITDSCIDRAIQGFEELEHLDLTGSKISDSGLLSINQRAGSLRTLSLERCDNITGQFLSNINQQFIALNSLSLSDCQQFDEGNFVYFPGMFPVLEEIQLYRLKLTDNGIKNIVQGARQLESLDIGETLVGDEGLRFIAEQCPNIRILNLYECLKITNVGIDGIAIGCPDIQELIIAGCLMDDNGLKSMANHCHKLVTLDLSDCNITDEGLKSLSEWCPNIENIYLGGCVEVTDQGISYLAKGIKAIKNLSLSECSNITGLSLQSISSWSHSLELLNISDCKGIDDNAYSNLEASFPNLHELIMYGNPEITDDAIRGFAKQFPYLQQLYMAGCRNVTDGSLQYLKELQMLFYLDLSNSGITDRGLDDFMSFPSLRTLILVGSSGVTAIDSPIDHIRVSVDAINNLRNAGIMVHIPFNTI